MIDLILLYWILPSLLTFLLNAHSIRKNDAQSLESMNNKYWMMLIVFSIIYPVGLVTIFTLDV